MYVSYFNISGMETIWVLVRGSFIFKPWSVRPHIQHRLHRDIVVSRHEKTDIQSTFGCSSNLWHIVRKKESIMFNQIRSFPSRYIVFNVPVHANATLSTVNHWFSVSEILSWVRMISKLTEKCNFLLPFRVMFMCFTRCLRWLFAHRSTWLSLLLWKGEYPQKSQP